MPGARSPIPMREAASYVSLHAPSDLLSRHGTKPSDANQHAQSSMHSISSLIEALQSLAQEHQAILMAGRALSDVLEGELSVECALAACDGDPRGAPLLARVVALRLLVIPVDQAGAKVGCLAELVLRGQTLAILYLLDNLRAALGEAFSRQEVCPWPGRHRTFEAVLISVLEALGRLNRHWMCHRKDVPRFTGPISNACEETRLFLYHRGIQRAQDAMLALADGPEIACLLACATGQSPLVDTLCRQLLDVLKVS